MDFIILGTGGIGAFYGAKLQSIGNNVTFIARGKQLEALKNNGLSLTHPTFTFNGKINVCSFEELENSKIQNCDAVIFTTKSASTKQLSQDLAKKINKDKKYPFLLSLQNGVENEDIICEYFPKNKVIGGLSRKIGAHIISFGVIEATGDVETIIGAIEQSDKNRNFLEEFKKQLIEARTKCEITKDIKFELWKKLIINNGVNALCALLRVKTGEIMSHKKLSKIVYGLMCETAIAARYDGIEISQDDVKQMFELIKDFDSIKPSMLVDVENNRAIELDEICNVVVEKCEKLNSDAPYTRTISTLLEYTYLEKNLIYKK
ncbi:ketopantoate reductase family protein [Halarcobacter anaerophilus]|uniref:2-dehydropantoate 2-reductase n=1 Tax=Halarcobacter anaerophilus TaxID=877500 RepID=A0A4Q0Y7W2_9BACT|nr:2-dehydropantoate 2-reductase [Halarcobacter anaerophilus]QDF29446.1 2-dehydropantoate 2-reductase [Halarcobacter anaerophilus]RXJ64691.1 ketopantoate reductase [Halarcobacter anaerophilus]